MMIARQHMLPGNHHKASGRLDETIKQIFKEVFMESILASQSVDISELKVNPNAVIENAYGHPVAVLNRNKPVAYLVPAGAWEVIMEKLDDLKLAEIIKERAGQPTVKVNLDEL